MKAIGMMSGTSLDGVDVVLVNIEGTGESTQVEQLAFKTYSIPDVLRQKIETAMTSQQLSAAYFTSLHVELGQFFASCALRLCEAEGISSQSLGFIASHGQTIYHIPRPTPTYVASTMQLGDGASIAYRCGCPVIYNFRMMDMAAGGEGAPLVPYSEWLLYRHKDHAVALQNLGGIGNVTVIPADAGLDDVFAFDTGPANVLINEAMRILYQLPYDDAGQTAATGQLISELCEQLKQHPYLTALPPKTTGREVFSVQMVQDICQRYQAAAPADIIATLTWYTAYCVAYHLERDVLPQHHVTQLIVGGGGAHNQTILAWLTQLLPTVQVLTQDDIGYSADAKEAIAFAIMGNETWHRRTSNVPRATGAARAVILGDITMPF